MSIQSAMVSRVCVRPTSKRGFFENNPSDHEAWSIEYHIWIHVNLTSILQSHTPLVPQSIVWSSELGPAPPSPPMRVLGLRWARALSLMCEVALIIPRIRENWQLVTDEPVEVEVGDFRRITNHFRRICGIYLKSMKENRRTSTTCNRLDLQTLGISTDYDAQKSPWSLNNTNSTHLPRGGGARQVVSKG